MPNNSNKEILLNGGLYNELHADTVSLGIGCMTTVSKIKMAANNDSQKLVYLNPNIAKRLLVPSRSYLPYHITSNTIKLGPSVGILISTRKSENLIPKGKQGRLLKEMITYGHKRGLFIFIFYTEGVNWKKKTIRGYTLNNNGKWVRGSYAIPTIVYNRINYRSIEARSNVKTLFKRLENQPQVFVFNTRFLNKWEVHEVLYPFPACRRFLPDTKKFNRTNLKNLLDKHKEIFLKPINNSRGQGIIKIIKRQNSFQYSKAAKGLPKWFTSSSFFNLFEALKRIGVREKRYLIQEGVDLAKIDDRVFDLRAQVQKDGTGKWVMTGVAVRIAGKGRFVTHIPNGGTAGSYEEVIKESRINTSKSEIDKQLRAICQVVPPKLEEGLNINLAILSLDIGIDKQGNLWILEINSKPASFDEDDIRFKHLHHLTNYLVFVAKKNAKE